MEGIAKYLNDEGVKTKRAGKWHGVTIKLILANNEYVDLGYVSQKEFDSVQELIKTRNNRAKK